MHCALGHWNLACICRPAQELMCGPGGVCDRAATSPCGQSAPGRSAARRPVEEL